MATKKNKVIYINEDYDTSYDEKEFIQALKDGEFCEGEKFIRVEVVGKVEVESPECVIKNIK